MLVLTGIELTGKFPFYFLSFF